MALVIYGSVLDKRKRKPRNINVAYTGQQFTKADHKKVEEWAKKRGLQGLPIEAFYIPSNKGVLLLPVPYELPLRYAHIGKDTNITVLPMKCTATISAALLAFGHSERKLRRALRVLSEAFPQRPCVKLSTDLPTPEEYKQGVDTLASLQRAITKAPALRKLTFRLWPRRSMKIVEVILRLGQEGDPPCTKAGLPRRESLTFNFKRNRIAFGTDKQPRTRTPKEVLSSLYPVNSTE